MPPAKQKLRKKLEQVEGVFDIAEILGLQTNKNYTQKYYKANQLAYSLFHTRTGIIHMGISKDGIYKEDDLLEAARIVEGFISKVKAKNILELATGRGGTSVWLAKQHPGITFDGIDLSEGQLVYAKKQATKLNNYHPLKGDYHDLSHYSDGSIDIVFVIEALCYSEDRPKVMTEVKRVLRKGGVFIVIDAYNGKLRSTMTKDELLACRLTELGMAVKEFRNYNSLLEDAKKCGFVVVSSQEMSQYILPTLRKFEKVSQKFFSHPKSAKLITRIFSKEVTYNAISALLMPDLVEQGLATYHTTVLKK